MLVLLVFNVMFSNILWAFVAFSIIGGENEKSTDPLKIMKAQNHFAIGKGVLFKVFYLLFVEKISIFPLLSLYALMNIIRVSTRKRKLKQGKSVRTKIPVPQKSLSLTSS